MLGLHRTRTTLGIAGLVLLGCLSTLAGAQATDSARSPPAAVEVRVVDEATGEPLAGATVKGWHHRQRTSESGEFSTVTDAAGRATIPSPPGWLAGMYLSASAPGYVPVQLDLAFPVARWAERGAPSTHELRLPVGTRIGGRVVDERGEPIAGAVVHVWAEPVEGYVSEPGVPRALCNGEIVTTGEDGRWTCDRLPEQRAKLWVGLTHREFVGDTHLRGIEEDDARAGTATVTMVRGRPFSGRVVDADGRPVAGARVIRARTVAGDEGTVITDAQGRFDGGRVTDDGFVFVVRAEGHAPLLHYLGTGEVTEDVVLTMPGTREVTVRILDSAGEPVAGWVEAHGWNKLSPPIRERLWTDESGEVTLQVPKVAVNLGVGTDGSMPQHVVVPADAGEMTVVARSPTRIEVVAVDAVTGEPVRPDRVAIFAPSDSYANWSLAQVTDAGATMRIDWPVNGEFSARVERVGYAVTTTSVVNAGPGETVTLRAELSPASPVAGRLLNPDGTPAAGASVLLLSHFAGLNVDERPRDDAQRAPTAPLALADEDGTFSIAREAAPVLFARSDDGYAFVRAEDFDGSLVRLRPWRPISLVLSHRGEPLAGASAGWHGLDESRLWLESMGRETDGYGRVVFPRTAGDTHRINFRTSGTGTTAFLWRRIEGDEPVEMRIELSAKLSGRAVAPEGLPEGWVYEMATLARPRDEDASLADAPRTVLDDPSEAWPVQVRTGVNSDGRFDFGPVEPGRYLLTLVAGYRGTGWACALGLPVAREQRWVELGDGETLDLGDVVLARVPRPEVGDVAPPMSAKTLEGEPFELTDLSGKVIVLDFWATWCAPCLADLPHMRALRDEFAGDERVVIVSASLDQTASDAANYVAGNDMSGDNWRHAYVGVASDVAEHYGVPSIPNVWIIAPDGRILARDLRARDAAAVVREAVGGR